MESLHCDLSSLIFATIGNKGVQLFKANGQLDVLNRVISSKDPLETARENEAEIDDMFLAVIQANAQEAQKRNDKNTLEALQAVYNIAMQIMSERQPPEVQLVNALLQAWLGSLEHISAPGGSG